MFRRGVKTAHEAKECIARIVKCERCHAVYSLSLPFISPFSLSDLQDVVFNDMVTHRKDLCPKELIKCECHEHFTRDTLAEHTAVCLDVTLQCPEVGCAVQCSRRDMANHIASSGAHHVECGLRHAKVSFLGVLGVTTLMYAPL